MLEISKILINGAKLEPLKLDTKTAEVLRIIDETKQKQKEILSLHFVDQEKLKMVVQL
jgi:hypothetical protein